MYRKITAGTTSRLTMVDHTESYGRHVLEKALRELEVTRCVDLGCGNGDDLMIVKNHNPKCHCIGIDCGSWNKEKLAGRGLEHTAMNIETEPLPFKNETVDLIIANQVLEHTKEIFWINHEIFRTLTVGGHLYVGVPNVLSLHNRMLGIFGIHPTSSKMISAHIRVFSKNDIRMFYEEVAKNFAVIEDFYGSQFYPFPKIISRPLAALMPSLAFSIFFLIRKTAKYDGEFVAWLLKTPLETNFYTGDAFQS